MEEKNDVADKRIGRLVPQVDFDISPHDLRDQPYPQAEAHERPEQPGLRGRSRFHIEQNGDGGTQKNNVLQNVAKGCEGKSARRKKRQQDVNAHHRAHDGRPLPGVLERRFSHAPDCMFARRQQRVTEVIETSRQTCRVWAYESASENC